MSLNLDQVVLGTRFDAPAKKAVTAEALRAALADYLEQERPGDAAQFSQATTLFMRASSVRLSKRASEEERSGRMATRSVNDIFTQIGQRYNAKLKEGDPHRLTTFHPQLLRHTFGVNLGQATHADEFELQRRLGHLSRKYIKVYTVPGEEVAARSVEQF